MSVLPTREILYNRRRNWTGRISVLLALIAWCATPALAQAPNSIDAVNVLKASSGRTVVKFTLKAPLANPPAGFSINDPPRIALDFPDTANGLGRTAQDVGDPSLRSLNVVQAGNRTRVVFNLTKPQSFETEVQGNVVLVTLTEQSTTASSR